MWHCGRARPARFHSRIGWSLRKRVARTESLGPVGALRRLQYGCTDPRGAARQSSDEPVGFAVDCRIRERSVEFAPPLVERRISIGRTVSRTARGACRRRCGVRLPNHARAAEGILRRAARDTAFQTQTGVPADLGQRSTDRSVAHLRRLMGQRVPRGTLAAAGRSDSPAARSAATRVRRGRRRRAICSCNSPRSCRGVGALARDPAYSAAPIPATAGVRRRVRCCWRIEARPDAGARVACGAAMRPSRNRIGWRS